MMNSILMPFQARGHPHDRCLNKALDNAEKTCEKRGLKLTKLRRRVLELIWQSHEPVKAYDILDRLKHDGFCSAPPTVYRTLEFLQTEGLVHKIESLNAYLGCGQPVALHQSQFLICLKCGTAAELADNEIRQLLASKAEALGFKIDNELIEIKGICSVCNQE